jgi:tripartite-type tricarboxylate transporter receptor subunit TctC
VLQLPDVRGRLDQLGADVVGDGPQLFDTLLKTDLARWAKVIKTADIKLD